VADDNPLQLKSRWRDRVRVYFLAGLLVFLPVAITLWFIGWVIGLLDSVLDVLPDSLHPNAYLPFAIPKLGAIVTLLLILFLGILTRGVATRRFLAAWENIFVKIPVFRGVYTAVQKLVQSFLGPSNAQRQVVMIEYPRAGVFTIGFAMGRAWSYLEEKKDAQLVNVFVPAPVLDVGLSPRTVLTRSDSTARPDTSDKPGVSTNGSTRQRKAKEIYPRITRMVANVGAVTPGFFPDPRPSSALIRVHSRHSRKFAGTRPTKLFYHFVATSFC